jgi:hypothetical protein
MERNQQRTTRKVRQRSLPLLQKQQRHPVGALLESLYRQDYLRAYFCWNLLTRPAVSMIFCLPV